jgi:sialate O-acetylesterase
MFSDHMVLQREQDIFIWGNGPEGVLVKADFLGRTYESFISQGRWLINLGTYPAGGPYELLLICETEHVRFEDILIGEIWLAGGQSNMEQPLFQSSEWKSDRQSFELPDLRIMTVPRRPFPDALIDGWHFDHTLSEWSDWMICTPDSIERFSAIGVYFGKNLTEKLDVPVGIISCNWGGTPIEAWMSRETLLGDPDLAFLIDEYDSLVTGMDISEYEKEFQKYQQEIRDYSNQIGDPVERIKTMGLEKFAKYHPSPVPTPKLGPKSFQRPCGLYENMILSIAPYTMQGVLWYQGESNGNAETAKLYEKMLTLMIDEWRHLWRKPDLFFALVQLSSFGGAKQPHAEETWPLIRQAQLDVSLKVDHVSMVVSADHGDKFNIHPLDKKLVSMRLAQSVLHRVYGQNETYRIPVCQSVRKEGEKLILTFSEPLEFREPTFPGARKGQEAEWELCGADGIFYRAKGTLDGCEIIVSCDEVNEPCAAAYGWSKRVNLVLFTKDGMPVSPFKANIEE